jgi:hypothetical protein
MHSKRVPAASEASAAHPFLPCQVILVTNEISPGKDEKIKNKPTSRE